MDSKPRPPKYKTGMITFILQHSTCKCVSNVIYNIKNNTVMLSALPLKAFGHCSSNTERNG
jgi:hypothetical protein